MSRTSISTGGIDFPLSDGEQTKRIDDSSPMHIAILADFSGRHSRGESASNGKPIEINRDNFDEVFERLNVSLRLPVSEQTLDFSELDELHPDFIYERIPLFDQLRALKRKLKKKDSFQQAAEEIQAWSAFKEQQPPERPTSQGIPMPDSLLTAALQGHDIAQNLNAGPLGNINTLIKDIVSPFIESKADPRQPELLTAVDKATSETMRSIMHHSDFQQLEASWRGLYWLLRNIEDSPKLKFYLIDISRDEAAADLQTDRANSHLYQQLVEARDGVDGTPFAIVLGDYQLQHSTEDSAMASQMAALAAAGGGCWISGGHENLAGCKDLTISGDPDNWLPISTGGETATAWQQLRGQPEASHLALAAPRFMLRLPYGKQTASTESFDFEELAVNHAHQFYLWGNGGFLLARLMLEGDDGLGEIGDLPLHVFRDNEGDSSIKPCAEVLLSDREAARFIEAGLVTLRSVHNSDSIRINHIHSLAINANT